MSVSVVSCQSDFIHRLKSPHHPPGTYVSTGEKHVTMKKTCRTAPPAHTSAVQRPGQHLKWALLTKGCTDTANKSPARSGWKQPASACQTSCTTTACSLQTFFPSLLPRPEWTPQLSGILSALLFPRTHARKYSVVVIFRLSHQHHSRECHTDNLCSYPFTAGAGRQKQRMPPPSSKVRALMGLPSHLFSR